VAEVVAIVVGLAILGREYGLRSGVPLRQRVVVRGHH
jgi:hypothetical protein